MSVENTSVINQTSTGRSSSSRRAVFSILWPVATAFALACLLLFAAGFADQFHQAAHDGRHMIGFPCH